MASRVSAGPIDQAGWSRRVFSSSSIRDRPTPIGWSRSVLSAVVVMDLFQHPTPTLTDVQGRLWTTSTGRPPVEGSWAFRPWLSGIRTFRVSRQALARLSQPPVGARRSTTGSSYLLGIVVPRPWSIVIIFASCCSAFSVRVNVVSAIIGLKR